jgi:hypothetical protein
MKISATLLSISTLLCGVFALHPKIRSPVDTQWSVYNYTEGCSPAACEYGFNIAGGSSPTDEPAFSTYCQGSDIAYKLQPFQDPATSSNDVSRFQNVTVVVQHLYKTSDGARHYVVGNHTFEDMDGDYPSAFRIQQSEVRTVA